MRVLPVGTGLALDRYLLRFRDGTVLAGGHPGRVITLTPEGAAALDALVHGSRTDDTAEDTVAELAGRLVDAGMAHPRRARALHPAPPVTVVVPVLDRVGELECCLTALGDDAPVVVVDDASRDPESVARVSAAHGARLVRRAGNGGPAAARRDGVAATRTELVAFVDSDCIVTTDWLDRLTWLFDDPTVGAVAPRVRPANPGARRRPRVVERFARAKSPLDLGPDEGEVGPGRAIPYVPTTALVVRRRALDSVGSFDPALRVGEDVDLVWRLVDAGWRVRYEPGVHVSHIEPDRWAPFLSRRLRYGTSGAPLAERHPGRLAPVELRLLPTAIALAVLWGRPRTAAVGVGVSAALLGRSVRRLGIPTRQVVRWSVQGAGLTVIGLGRAATMLGGPALVAMVLGGRRPRRAGLTLVLVPPLVEWFRRRPDLDPVRWVAASVADDVAYGTGVWLGCVRSRSFGALLPAIRLRSTDS